jgi:hypothetical protein
VYIPRSYPKADDAKETAALAVARKAGASDYLEETDCERLEAKSERGLWLGY